MTPDTALSASDAARAAVRMLVAEERYDEAWRELRPLLLRGGDSSLWNVARNLLKAAGDDWSPPSRRAIRLGLLCTYESAELTEILAIACAVLGIEATIHAAPYGQLEQEALDGGSALARFKPTHVLIAPTTDDLAFPQPAEDPAAAVSNEEARWRMLWRAIAETSGARVVQHGFVVPDEEPLGHLALRMPGSRLSLVRELNRRLGEAAGGDVLLVDCERVAARLGKRRWLDPRLWYAARMPLAAEALPLLALETAAVLAGDVGLAARCLVVDLDNTLWGGLVAEEGAEGVAVGEGAEGEAYAEFQEYLKALRNRGVLLAVASKNDLAVARQPFELNPRMRLRSKDFSAFVADWRRKPEQIAEIAGVLGLGLEALVFADDNPAECAEVAAALPAVETIVLDVPPSEYVRTLASCLRFETSSLTDDDLGRQRSYSGRAQAEKLRVSATSLEEFWRSLEMKGQVERLTELTIDRAVQLTQKTNQFNLTLARRSREDVERLGIDETAICRTLSLKDRFADHGLVGLAFLLRDESDPDVAQIDTLLLSCRVIGRTAEVHMLSHLSRAALDAGYTRLRGVYVPGPRNALVADLYPRLGFTPVNGTSNAWEYDINANGPIESLYIADIG